MNFTFTFLFHVPFCVKLLVKVAYDIVQQGNVAEALRLTEEYLTLGN